MLALAASGGSGLSWKAPEVVTSYVNGTSPTLILGFDNNLEICLALRQPRSPEALREDGVTMTDSQRVLMQLWRLIERNDLGELRCTVPIIEGAVAERLQALAGTVAEDLIDSLGPEIDRYLVGVTEDGWTEASYVLLGSFVMDGLVWEALERIGAISSADPGELASGSDYWSGVAWITVPPQDSRLGTNSQEMDGGSLHVAWTPASLVHQEALQHSWFREAMATAAFADPATASVAAGKLEALGVVRADALAVPLIQAGSRVCEEGGRLAMQMSRALVESEAFREGIGLIDARSDTVATIMVYHWVYPAMLERLGARGITPPAILEGVPGAPLAPSLYVTRDLAACLPRDG